MVAVVVAQLLAVVTCEGVAWMMRAPWRGGGSGCEGGADVRKEDLKLKWPSLRAVEEASLDWRRSRTEHDSDRLSRVIS